MAIQSVARLLTNIDAAARVWGRSRWTRTPRGRLRASALEAVLDHRQLVPGPLGIPSSMQIAMQSEVARDVKQTRRAPARECRSDEQLRRAPCAARIGTTSDRSLAVRPLLTSRRTAVVNGVVHDMSTSPLDPRFSPLFPSDPEQHTHPFAATPRHTAGEGEVRDRRAHNGRAPPRSDECDPGSWMSGPCSLRVRVQPTRYPIAVRCYGGAVPPAPARPRRRRVATPRCGIPRAANRIRDSSGV